MVEKLADSSLPTPILSNTFSGIQVYAEPVSTINSKRVVPLAPRILKVSLVSPKAFPAQVEVVVLHKLYLHSKPRTRFDI